MSAFRNALGALAFIAAYGIANAIATNSGEYAAPTEEEIEADVQAQRADLCSADGWPDDDQSKLAFQRACRSELGRKH